MHRNNAQSLVEYIIIVGVVMIAVYMMVAPAMKRGTQSVIKATADQLGQQVNAEQDYDETSSHMESSNSSVKADTKKSVIDTGTGISTISSDTTQSFSTTQTNGGIN